MFDVGDKNRLTQKRQRLCGVFCNFILARINSEHFKTNPKQQQFLIKEAFCNTA